MNMFSSEKGWPPREEGATKAIRNQQSPDNDNFVLTFYSVDKSEVRMSAFLEESRYI